MPQKKQAKNSKSKKTSQRQSKANHTAQTLKMEKHFHQSAALLVTHSRQNLAAAKQHESRIQNALKKAQQQQKTTANKLHALSAKAKTNKAAKKQFASLNRAHSKHEKQVHTLQKQYDQAAAITEQHHHHLAKYNALNKALDAFSKEWRLSAKKTVKSSKKRTKKLTVSTPAIQQEPLSPVSPEAHIIMTNDASELN